MNKPKMAKRNTGQKKNDSFEINFSELLKSDDSDESPIIPVPPKNQEATPKPVVPSKRSSPCETDSKSIKKLRKSETPEVCSTSESENDTDDYSTLMDNVGKHVMSRFNQMSQRLDTFSEEIFKMKNNLTNKAKKSRQEALKSTYENCSNMLADIAPEMANVVKEQKDIHEKLKKLIKQQAQIEDKFTHLSTKLSNKTNLFTRQWEEFLKQDEDLENELSRNFKKEMKSAKKKLIATFKREEFAILNNPWLLK